MKRSLFALSLAALFVVISVGRAATFAAPADDLDLKKIREMASAYDAYAHSAAEGTWEKGELLATAKTADEKAWDVEGGAISIDKDGMKITANAGVGCFVTLARRSFKGPIGIRYDAMTPAGANPCDLSVRFGPAGKPTTLAFAFGGYANNDNFFYLGKTRKVIAKEPLITPGQWYAVECLVTPESITAKVDGKVVGKEKLTIPVRGDAEHGVTLYVWATTGVFKNVQLMKYIPPKADTRAWEEVMGKTSKDDLKVLSRRLGNLLGDDNFSRRQSAEEILFLLRPFSEDVVKEQLKSSDLEVHLRAERIAAKMGFADESATRPGDPKNSIIRQGVDRVDVPNE